MRMSDGVEWATHCALMLASLGSEATLSAKDLAELHGISPSYLLKHLKAMTKARILDSIPGPKGGYRLARSPEAITLLDIVEAIEGPVTPFVCTEIRQRGPLARPSNTYRAPCLIHATFREAEREYRQALRSRTLADIAAGFRRSTSPDVVDQYADWVGSHAHGRPEPNTKERA